ncbi:potassium channel SKOR-like [Pyrus ussuriensis x Pyrus communis]|uniref:Potassium channel SKOR-like n=1 Tax=Pyrus ussuriensis x Pyrus communis TaxID=2448454 RepID=A0A5N5EXU9_9ROSA|nr:potassium channel SKOR-like [Pyrus ussuriensis x Pyrus communis]
MCPTSVGFRALARSKGDAIFSMLQMPLDEGLNLDLPPIFDRCLDSDCLINLDLPPKFDRSPYGTYHFCCQKFLKLEFHDLIGVDVFYFKISKVLVDIINQMKENVKVARYAINDAFHTSIVNIKCSKYLFVWTGRVQFYRSKSDDDPNSRTNSLQPHQNDASQRLKVLLHKITGNWDLSFVI